MKVQRYGMKLVTLTTPVTIAVLCSITMETVDATELQNLRTAVTLPELLFLFYFTCGYLTHTLELSKVKPWAPHPEGCPITELCLDEENLRTRHMPGFSPSCTLGKCFAHNWASNMHCCIFKSPNFPLEYFHASKTSSG